jgi:hypothetical protein
MIEITRWDVCVLLSQFAFCEIEHMGWESRLARVDLNDDGQLGVFIGEWVVPMFKQQFKTPRGIERCKESMHYFMSKGQLFWTDFHPIKGIDEAADKDDYQRRLMRVHLAIWERLFGEPFKPAADLSVYCEREGTGFANAPDHPERWEKTPRYRTVS